MANLTDEFKQLIQSDQATPEELQSMKAKMGAYRREINSQIAEYRAELERPSTVQAGIDAKAALDALMMNVRIQDRMYEVYGRAYLRAVARAAAKSADHDRKAVDAALSEVDKLRAKLAQAEGELKQVVDDVHEKARAVKSPDASNLKLESEVGVSEETAQGLENTGLFGRGLLMRIVRPVPEKKAA